MHTFDIGDYATYGLAVSPDGKTLAACAGGLKNGDVPGDPFLWDLESGKRLAHFAKLSPSSHASPRRPAFSPDGKTLAVGFSGLETRLFDVATRKEKAVIDGSPFVFSPDGKYLVTPCFIWDLVAGRNTDLHIYGQPEISTLAFSPDGKLLATGSGPYERQIQLWSWPDLKLLGTGQCQGGIQALAFSPDSATLASASAGGFIYVDR